MSEHAFEAIGTHWKILLPDALPADTNAALLVRVRERIDEFDRNYSRFRSDSLVTKMSQEAGVYALPADAKPMLDLYRELYALTGGLVTPLIGQVLSDAGYDAQYSLVPRALSAPPSWDEALRYDFPTLEIKTPVLLDFGAAGKGYLVDIVAELILGDGVESFTINAGGDIRVYSAAGEPVRIGLEHPQDPSLAIGVATLANKSICGSAGNRRAWGAFHHIMDPHTLAPSSTVAAAWVVADSTLLADALATCLFFVPPRVLAAHYPFAWLMMFRDSSVERSDDFPAELFVSA